VSAGRAQPLRCSVGAGVDAFAGALVLVAGVARGLEVVVVVVVAGDDVVDVGGPFGADAGVVELAAVLVADEDAAAAGWPVGG
jgi:hypothetical protein